MNRYIIKLFTDFTQASYSAYAESWLDEDLQEVIETEGATLVDSSVPEDFICQIEGCDNPAIAVSQMCLEDYYNYSIELFEGTDEEFNKLILLYDGRTV